MPKPFLCLARLLQAFTLSQQEVLLCNALGNGVCPI